MFTWSDTAYFLLHVLPLTNLWANSAVEYRKRKLWVIWFSLFSISTFSTTMIICHRFNSISWIKHLHIQSHSISEQSLLGVSSTCISSSLFLSILSIFIHLSIKILYLILITPLYVSNCTCWKHPTMCAVFKWSCLLLCNFLQGWKLKQVWTKTVRLRRSC